MEEEISLINKEKENVKEFKIVSSMLFEEKMIKKSYEFYLGNCLKILPNLEKKYTLIYLDPPFCTGRDFQYSAHEKVNGFKDKWESGEYEKWLNEVIGLCKSKLTKDGTLFFHISAELSKIPEKVLNKYFRNIDKIFWKKAHGKNTVKRRLGAVIDIIFKCSDNGAKFNLLYTPLDKYYFENSYKNKDNAGFYALGSIKHDKTRKGHSWKFEKDGIIYETPYGWKISEKKFRELLNQNRIHFAKSKNGTKKGMLYKKLYKHETKGKPLSNLWDDISYITRTTKDLRLYPTQKPLELLKRIIALASDREDWILDPVAGSGTTGAAALELGRNVTLIEVNEDAATIIKKRLDKISKEK